jgi:hypothetical protein
VILLRTDGEALKFQLENDVGEPLERFHLLFQRDGETILAVEGTDGAVELNSDQLDLGIEKQADQFTVVESNVR